MRGRFKENLNRHRPMFHAVHRLRRTIILLWMATMLTIAPDSAPAEGDQFLDGIGETALIARYRFDGNLADGSRNSLHASMGKGDAVFEEDARFGWVLALPGGQEAAGIDAPERAFDGVESLSVAGWIKIKPVGQRQPFFDLGTDRLHRIHCAVTRNSDEFSLEAGLLSPGNNISLTEVSAEGNADGWLHLAVVLDRAGKTLSLFANGARVAHSTVATAPLPEVLNTSDPAANHLLIGRSATGSAGLNGSLHDVRFYRTALTGRQVAIIHHNAVSEEPWGEMDKEMPAQNNDQTRLLTEGLLGIPAIEVETSAGQLPRLPRFVPGRYTNHQTGPAVRVIWPAPQDNQAVLRTGSYTVTGRVPGTGFSPVARVVVKKGPPEKPPRHQVLKPFPAGQVILTPDETGHPTPFMQHRDKFIKGLAATNPDSFLYTFRNAFGQPQPAGTEPLYGWDSQTTRLRGHASGHYLTAIAQAYAGSSDDPRLHDVFEKKMNHMVDVLYELSRRSGRPAKKGGPYNSNPASVPMGPGKDCYDSDLSTDGIRTDCWNWGKGFISGYPPDQFIMLEQGASYGADNNQVWAPYYTLHKILAGLMDCYEAGRNPKALAVAAGMGTWVCKRLDALPPETRTRMWNSYIAGEYGGMNEAMARLFRLTDNPCFLICAKQFDNTDFFFGGADHRHGLACNVDTLRGKHANQHIPQITGALETYKADPDAAYYRVAENFWDRCTQSYMYSIGGVAGARTPNNAECFTAEPDTLFRNGLSESGQNETCATYNLLKLSRQLFMFEPDATYMNYYERALYNHILASVAEHDSGNTYHVPLNPGAVKSFSNARMNSFTCCNGTALESATKLQNTIYLQAADSTAVYVNLYIPSRLIWRERGIGIIQSTRFPNSDSITLTLSGSGAFSIHLRIPDWAKQGVKLQINGKSIPVTAVPGRYLELNRMWRDGDTLELKLPMDFHLRPLMDQPDIASIFYGPVLLAAEEPEVRSDWRELELDPEQIGAAFTGDPSTLQFNADGTRFKPFYETYDRHSVYLKIVPAKSELPGADTD